MPVRRFWMLHRNITRIQAEEDLRQLTTVNAAQSPEAAKDYRQQLIVAIGEVSTVVDNERDEAGIENLKIMSGQTLGQKV